MHARPATMLAGLVKKAGATVRLTRDDGRSADATRLMDLLSLGLTQGTRFTVSTDQEALLGTLLDAIRSGLGDDLQGASPHPPLPAAPPSGSPRTWTTRCRVWAPPTAWSSGPPASTCQSPWWWATSRPTR
ncbi:HPr family phosphocarrier protein [Deinococcus wulumuqiensis]|uniref:HPr family phosphocarrier protein n=1 Tax=Deinococcus wulumuqiensis TaxID=980427 RepID=UPI00298F5879|nr:HPr family phosphocarrier protein [Deinococcus wulumuqiensis]